MRQPVVIVVHALLAIARLAEDLGVLETRPPAEAPREYVIFLQLLDRSAPQTAMSVTIEHSGPQRGREAGIVAADR
jgi:hypothetical protein